MCVCVYLSIYVCAMCVARTQRDQKKVLVILELELETVISHLMLVLGTDLRFSTRASILVINFLLQTHAQPFYVAFGA